MAEQNRTEPKDVRVRCVQCTATNVLAPQPRRNAHPLPTLPRATSAWPHRTCPSRPPRLQTATLHRRLFVCRESVEPLYLCLCQGPTVRRRHRLATGFVLARQLHRCLCSSCTLSYHRNPPTPLATAPIRLASPSVSTALLRLPHLPSASS